jgi:tetratricopeptide (TPR) repeat protein
VDPRFVPALLLEAERLEAKDDLEAARETRRRAIALSEDGRAQALLELGEALRDGRREDVVDARRRFLRVDRAAPSPYLGVSLYSRMARGKDYLESEDFVAASAELAAARALWPELPGPAILLGEAYHRSGDPDKAEETFRELAGEARLHPDPRVLDQAALGIAQTWIQLRDPEKALEWAEKARQTSLRESLRCDYLRRLGRLDEAVAAGKRAVALDESSHAAYCHLAAALLERNVRLLKRGERANLPTARNGEETIAVCRKAVKLNPRCGGAWDHLRRALRLEGRTLEAVEALGEALEHYDRAI